MITVTFNGTAQEIRAEMERLLGSAAVTTAPAVSEVSSDKTSQHNAATPAPPTPPEQKKRGRPAKAAPVAETPAEPEQQAEEPQPEAPTPADYTVDNIRQVVGEYIGKHGIDVARQDIATMMAKDAPGVANIGALAEATPDVRRAVYAAVKAAVDAGTRLVEAA